MERPGLVASRRRFVASPDSEILSGGINMKGDRGTPLLREGNLFLWGFAGAPSQMTESGRDAFANAVVYIAQFDGQAPTVRIGVEQRHRYKDILGSPYIEGTRDLRNYFSAEIVDACGDDKDKYTALVEPNVDFIYVPKGTKTYAIDEDAAALGIANNDIALIATAIELNDDRAQRILDRYWPEDQFAPKRPTTIEELFALEGTIFFSEDYGYRWMNDVPLGAPEMWEVNDALEAADIATPTGVAPAMFGARLVGSYVDGKKAYASRLSRITIAVRARIHPQWKLTLDAGDSFNIPVSIDVDLPDGCEWESDTWTILGKRTIVKGALVATGEVTWTRTIKVHSPVGVHPITGTINFQACDATMCLRPMTAPIDLTLEVR